MDDEAETSEDDAAVADDAPSTSGDEEPGSADEGSYAAGWRYARAHLAFGSSLVRQLDTTCWVFCSK